MDGDFRVRVAVRHPGNTHCPDASSLQIDPEVSSADSRKITEALGRFADPNLHPYSQTGREFNMYDYPTLVAVVKLMPSIYPSTQHWHAVVMTLGEVVGLMEQDFGAKSVGDDTAPVKN